MRSDILGSLERGRRPRGFGAVLATILLVVALSAGGLVTTASLTDDERVNVSMAAAETFSIESLTEADYLLDLDAANGDEWHVVEDGSIEWRIESDGPDLQSIVIAATTPENRTFVVSERELLATVGAKSLGDVSMTLDDGTPLRFTRRMAHGSDWLIFTMEHFSTRTIHLETEPDVADSTGGNTTLGPLSSSASNNTSVGNGTVVDTSTANGTDENSRAVPSNSSSGDPLDSASAGNLSSAFSTNETVEPINGTQPSGNETDEGLASADSTNGTSNESDPALSNGTVSSPDGSMTDGTSESSDTTNTTDTTGGSSTESNTTDSTGDSTTSNTTNDGSGSSTNDPTDSNPDGSTDTTTDGSSEDGTDGGTTDGSSPDTMTDDSTEDTATTDDDTQDSATTDEQTEDDTSGSTTDQDTQDSSTDP